MMRGSILAVLLGAACSGGGGGTGGDGGDGAAGVDAAPEPAYTSGTRLVANVLSTGEGAVAFQDWHDTTLDLDCRFGTAEDGEVRCLPTDAAGAASYFLDELCVQPLAVVASSSTCLPPPAYVLFRDERACPITTSVAETGAVLSPVPDKIYIRSAVAPFGACSAVSPSATSIYYQRGVPVPAATLARAELAARPATPRVVADVWVAEDGARQRLSTGWDNQRGAACAIDQDPDGLPRCYPAASAIDWGFHSDATCTAPVIQAPANACEGPPATARHAEQTACQGSISRYYQVGPPETVTALASDLDGTCGPDVIDAGYLFYTRGDELLAASFEPATTVEEPTGGRLVARWDVVGGLRHFRTWHDSILDADCSFIRSTDGETRCVPSGASVSVTYTDSTCTTPRLLVETRTETGCPAPPKPRFGRLFDSTCPSDTELYEVGDAITPTIIYRKGTTGSCTGSSPAAGSTYYVAGPTPVPVADLAKGVRTRE